MARPENAGEQHPNPRNGEEDLTCLQLPETYPEFLEDMKTRIRSAQVRAAFSANRELILLYWDTGRRVAERQQAADWGSAIIERLASDLHRAFPDLKGFSRSNIWRMRAFYLAYSGPAEKLAQAVREMQSQEPPELVTRLPWGHNVALFERVKDAASANGTWRRPLNTAGVETFSSIRSRPAYANVKGKRSPISTGPFRSHSQTWRGKP